MSADATMATWGGSTVDNMESITEDGVDGNQASDNEEVDDGQYLSYLISTRIFILPLNKFVVYL